MTTDQDVLESILTEYGDNVNSISLINKYANDNSYVDYIIGNENPYTVYKDVLPQIDCKNITIYDQMCNEAIQMSMSDYFKGKISYDQALDNFYDMMQDVYPELLR